MNRRTASRNSTTVVLVLFLAGVAAPAVAMPVEGYSGPDFLRWTTLSWLHSLAESFVGVVRGADDSAAPGALYGEANASADPNGSAVAVTAESPHPSTETAPAHEAMPLPK